MDFKTLFSRSTIAHLCMVSAVILLGIGFAQFDIGWGLISWGAGIGVYGYLLGAE